MNGDDSNRNILNKQKDLLALPDLIAQIVRLRSGGVLLNECRRTKSLVRLLPRLGVDISCVSQVLFTHFNDHGCFCTDFLIGCRTTVFHFFGATFLASER